MSNQDNYSSQKYAVERSIGGYRKALIIVMVIVLLIANIAAFIEVVNKIKNNIEHKREYQTAVEIYERASPAYDRQALNEADTVFHSLSDYKDSYEYASKIDSEMLLIDHYNQAIELYEEGKYQEAYDCFYDLCDYRDSNSYISRMSRELFDTAEAYLDSGNGEAAKQTLMLIPTWVDTYYEGAQEMIGIIQENEQQTIRENTYLDAVNSYNAGDYDSAQKKFMTISDYSNSSDYLNLIGEYYYGQAQQCSIDRNYGGVLDNLEYIDTAQEWTRYKEAIALKQAIASEYYNYVMETAQNKLHSEGYSSFKDYVNNSQNEFFTSSDANDLLQKYQPVPLRDLTPYESGEWEAAPYLGAIGWSNRDFYYEDGVPDENGKVHNNVLLGGGTYAVYHLGGRYSMLSGSMFVIQGCSSTKDKPVFLLVRNGYEDELYRNTVLSGYGTVDFCIDVSGVEDIEIFFDGYEGDFVYNDQFGGVGELCLIP